jgi:hypothetical protein
MTSLISQNLRGAATDANAGFVTLQVPPEEKLLEGSGSTMTARVVVFDSRAKRASGTDDKTVLKLRAKKAPLPLLLIGGIVGGVLVLALLAVVLLRGGGNKRGGGTRGGGPPPQPVIAGGGYGPPPQGGGGGYGGPPQGGGGYGPPPGGGGYGGPPQGGGGGYGGGGAGYAPVVSPAVQMSSVRCQACNMTTQIVLGADNNVCFSCGQAVSSIGEGGVALGPSGFSADFRSARASTEGAHQSVWC